MRQRTREREQVLDDRSFCERFYLHGAKREAGGLELRHDLGEVAPSAHEDGYRGDGILALRLAHQLDDPGSLPGIVLVKERMHRHRLALQRRMHGHRCGIGHGPDDRVLPRRHHSRKGRVDPLDDARLRTEVRAQLERLQCNRADSRAPGLQEKPHLGLAEPVDRLHRVADRKQGTPVLRFPSLGEPRHQFVLADGSVLELVDQQVADAIVKREGQVGGLAFRTQRTQRALGDLRKIHLATRLENELELRNGVRQHRTDGGEHGSLLVRILCRRQGQHRLKDRAQGFAHGPFFGIALGLCRALAPPAILGQQGLGKCLPSIRIPGVRPRVERLRMRDNAQALCLKRGLQVGALHAREVANPVVTAREHVGQQPPYPANVIVEVLEEALHLLCHAPAGGVLGRGAFDERDGRKRGLVVEFPRVVDAFRLRAEL